MVDGELIRQAFKRTKEDLMTQNLKIDEIFDELKEIKQYLSAIAKNSMPASAQPSAMPSQFSSNDHRSFIKKYLSEVQDIANKIDIEQINKAINILYEAWKNNNHVYFAGCGGSAGTASHFAADMAKTTLCKGKKRFKVISLVDNPSLTTAWINDEGWENVFSGQIENFMKPGDVIITISVHGGSGKGNALAWSQNLTKAMQFVKDRGGKAIGIAGFDGGAFKEIGDACIIVPKDSTPLVEGFHCDIQHMIIFRLKELLEKA